MGQNSLTKDLDILEIETVVLVADDGTPIGTADKALVHDDNTALHLAFSCHVFDENGRILVTRRALTKKAWPGVWTNSFCGHPAPSETLADAARRRAGHELGIALTELTLVLPDFRYRAIDASGIVENEICPVFTAITHSTVVPRADEVMEWRWVPRDDLVTAVRITPWAFSPWLTLQLPLLFPQG
ncbi:MULTISPECIES: isopentenyl-diphosphate Delta-isomerase [Cryobacterium]|uniref:Isopentenyl-diphosphate Delta-isomerase n=1 Tax=Cryobacterium levicorallinum TaxID=995038 RepID=A0ABY1EDH5_9MICO|nr:MULTISPECIES: isopentenyl-diphosphate Delta-isomerase [Cryobacterium]GEP26527.1 isopentenyl-diphosphate Delta-isomerase [Cryobacterium levicorallinum]SFH49806.1 isopentenyl-diphosphate delta-isomerase [Cryobacterium levicorallinum]